MGLLYCGVQRASMQRVPEVLSRGKAAGTWNWPLKSQCNCTFAILYAFLALNRVSFTFKDRNIICNILERGTYVRVKKLSMVLFTVVDSVLIIFVNCRFYNLLLCTVFCVSTQWRTYLRLQQLKFCYISSKSIWSSYSLNCSWNTPLYLSCCAAVVHQTTD